MKFSHRRQMPERVVKRASELLEQNGVTVRGARVVLAGMAYKKDIDDLRESPALDVYRLLSAAGADVVFTDPMVPGQGSFEIIGSINGAVTTRKNAHDIGTLQGSGDF